MKKYEVPSYEVENEEIVGTKQVETAIPEILVEKVQRALNEAASQELTLWPALVIPDGLGIMYMMVEHDDDKNVIGRYRISITKASD